jgi:hypothetical protein
MVPDPLIYAAADVPDPDRDESTVMPAFPLASVTVKVPVPVSSSAGPLGPVWPRTQRAHGEVPGTITADADASTVPLTNPPSRARVKGTDCGGNSTLMALETAVEVPLNVMQFSSDPDGAEKPLGMLGQVFQADDGRFLQFSST